VTFFDRFRARALRVGRFAQKPRGRTDKNFIVKILNISKKRLHNFGGRDIISERLQLAAYDNTAV
jgi:hypothetical protein